MGGKSGWRWGASGKCYVGPGARAKAEAQGAAARAAGFTEKGSELERFEHYVKAEGVNDELGLVFGWGIVCQEDIDKGDYWDTQDDHIPQDSMLREAADFALHSRKSRDMHRRDDGEGVVFMFPLTDETAKAFGITCQKRGLMIALKPGPAVLQKFKNGTYTGFSIGGLRIEDEVVED